MMRQALALLAALGLAACSSTLISEDLQLKAPKTPGGRQTVAGIPYRVPDGFVVDVYQKTDKGYTLAKSQMMQLPDPSALYVMNVDGQLLSNANMKLELHKDSTISTIHLADESHAAATTMAVSNGITSVAKEQQAIRAAAATRAGEPEAALEDYTHLAALACAAQATYHTKSPSNSAEAILAKDDMVQAKLKANAAASKYGAQKPFPNSDLTQDDVCS